MFNVKHILKAIFFIASLAIISCSQNTYNTNQEVIGYKSSRTTELSDNEREEYKKGIAALTNKDLKLATDIFMAFKQQHPGLAGAYSNLGLIHYKLNNYELSTRYIEAALKLNPKQSQAYNIRAQLHLINGEIKQARNNYIKAINLNPSYAIAHYNLALLYDIYLQDIEPAIKHYEKFMLLQKMPDETTKNWIKHLKGTLKNG